MISGEGQVEHEAASEIRDELFRATERSIAHEYNQERPPIPESERTLEELKDSSGNVLGAYYKVREPKKYTYKDREETWVLFDFDDVISRTTDYNNERGRRIAEHLGIPEAEYHQFYKAAKVKNAQGKSVFQREVLLQTLKEHYPHKAAAIDEVFAGMDQKQFLNQGVLRAMQALRHDGGMMRMSILTYGERAYQRSRVEASGILDYVDDVVYTEGSKREVLEHLVQQQYPKRTHADPHSKQEVDTPLPNIITVDDSPEHVDDYAKLEFGSKFANIRFLHPSAKLAAREHAAPDAVVANEREQNQAALALYHMISIGGSDRAKEKALWWSDNPSSRQNMHDLLRDPEQAWSVLHHVRNAYPDEDISYHREGDDIVREWTNYPTPHMWGIEEGPLDGPPKQEGRRLITSTGHAFAQQKREKYHILPDGTVEDFQHKAFDPEEYILAAENQSHVG